MFYPEVNKKNNSYKYFSVVHALHLMIAAKMNELAIETISCKIIPTTSITYYDDTFEDYQYHNTLSALHRAMLFNNTEDVSLDLIDAILTYYPEDLYARSDTGTFFMFMYVCINP